jgi:hypothetical protein
MGTGAAPPIDLASLHGIAFEAMHCDACLARPRELSRSFVELPQPRYVGPKYASSSPRIAWLMINPGAGSVDSANRRWLRVLRQYREGGASLTQVFAEQREHMPYWSGLMPFIAKHGLSVDRLALVNVAWCATVGNQHPAKMLARCWDRHTAKWVAELAPQVVILSGSATHRYAREIRALLPSARCLEAFHYAHRGADAARANARAVEIRTELGL